MSRRVETKFAGTRSKAYRKTMTFQQKVFSLSVALVLLVAIIDMVRRRKLGEELSIIWLLAGVSIILLAVWEYLLLWLCRLLGINAPVSLAFFMGIIYLLAMNLQLSIKISTINKQIKSIAQKLALLEWKIKNKDQH